MGKKYYRIALLLGLSLVLVGVSPRLVFAKTYYVSSSGGNDNNSGTSESQPFQTITKVNSLNLVAGDSVLFKCGDTWRAEQLKITKSGTANARITFGSYPTGCPNKPIISGAQMITGWTVHTGNIYKAELLAGANAGKFLYGINQLFKDGQRLPMGRWPNINAANGGYSAIDTHPASNQITDSQLPAVNWNGSMVHPKTYRWTLYNRKVIGTSGQTLTLDDGIACDGGCVGWGFFINNHLNTLDQNGEWYYDAANNIVYLYSTSVPSGTFEGSVVLDADYNNYQAGSYPPYGLEHGGVMIDEWGAAQSVAYVTIQNLELRRWFNHGIGTPTGKLSGIYHDVTIQNMTIKDVEGTGIHLKTGSGTTTGGYNMYILNNLIDGANHFGIAVYSYNSIIRDNTIRNIGLLKNLGRYGLGCGITDVSCDENGDAIRIRHDTTNHSASGHGNTIRYNRIDTIGYCGIDIFSHNNTVDYNFVKGTMYTKSDGAGIRVDSNQRSLATTDVYSVTIQNNIVTDSIGNTDGVGVADKNQFGMGIVVDLFSKDVIVSGNTVINTTLIGILFGQSTGQVTGNTVYNPATGGTMTAALQLFDYLVVNSTTRVTIQNNIFYALSRTVWTLYASYLNNVVTSNNNYFFHPYKADHIAYGSGSVTQTNLAGWQSASGQDSNSKQHWFTNQDIAEIFYNDTKIAKTISLGAMLYQDLDQNPVSGSITLQPFTSKILINTGQTIPSNSYLLWTR